MRRLASVGITTHEACGNVIRNVTACPLAGICNDETFDVSPYAKAMSEFMLNHPDCQDFGRKFKIAFSGCSQHACGIVNMHDLGAIAKNNDGKNGFEIYVGGGLGAVAHQAKVMYEFLPEEEILPLMQAIGRVFARLGEKKNRAKARVKFLVAKLGLTEFMRLVIEERTKLPHDDNWTKYIDELPAWGEKPKKPTTTKNVPGGSPALVKFQGTDPESVEGINDFQSDLEDQRAKGIAGAGGQKASQGESVYCGTLNTLDNDKFKEENASVIEEKKKTLKIVFQ